MSTNKSLAILEILTVGGNFDPVDNQNSPKTPANDDDGGQDQG